MNRKLKRWARDSDTCVNCRVYLDYGIDICWECLRMFLVGIATAAAVFFSRLLFG